ncbi:ABC transporter ATP-binding protein [Mycoplasma seminis]|uniref:ABC transporter ATP-binding protein n=1 Tax=Mycoplasma seminis TaxID=512749 RepID=A0ABY9H9H8_9MOLU|nr:ABC transporter ATP-binding protein [Mycoplasma seminis]WLP85151.1 ABC transporter ATP-binding protein [Mycoplasma seminis]
MTKSKQAKITKKYKESLPSLFSLTKGARLYATASILLVIAEVIMQVFMPQIVGNVIDEGIAKANKQIVIQKGLILIGLALAALVSGILVAFTSAKASSIFARNMRNAIFEKVQEFSFNDIDKFSNGVILNRLNNDVNNIQMAFNMIIRAFVRLPFMFIAAIVFAIQESLKLSAIFLVSLPIIVLLFIAIWFSSYPKYKLLYKQYDAYNQKIQENLNGMRTIKSYVTEKLESDKVETLANQLKVTNTKVDKIVAWNNPVILGAIFMSVVALAGIGTNLFIDNSLQIGSIVAFGSYIWMISGSLMGIMNVLGMILMAIPSSKRVKEIIYHVPSITNSLEAIKQDLLGGIKFENVSFSYHGNNVLSLDNINLSIPAGASIGIIGETGSGKTTFTSLIARFYDPQIGNVYLDDTNIKHLDLTYTKSQIAQVFQESTLFKGTLRENICWGKQDASDEEIFAALKQANIYDYVMALPDGLNHPVSQKGQNFSGGQKQRLCIARALIKQPKILILDDATSAVDFKTEAQIKKAINNIKQCTKIIIAQKINTIKDCDQILVFENGEIANIGTHDELLNSSEFYAELAKAQQSVGGIDEILSSNESYKELSENI